jgi:hypothetical protein
LFTRGYQIADGFNPEIGGKLVHHENSLVENTAFPVPQAGFSASMSSVSQFPFG